jgi:hypothetical protein
MLEPSTIEVTDRDGWRKAFPLAKAIVYIGSGAGADVLLEPGRGKGVAARHLQLIALGDAFRLINIGDSEVRLGPAGEVLMPPRAVLEVSAGEQVRVGEFTLTLQGQAGPAGATMAAFGADNNSPSIGLALAMQAGELTLDHPLEGAIVVKNLGDKAGVQFKLEAAGLDPACMELGPSPILFPNAEKEVPFRLRHPAASRPLAGDFRFRIRATAPAAYPGESATISQVIKVGPYYRHAVRLVVPEETDPSAQGL